MLQLQAKRQRVDEHSQGALTAGAPMQSTEQHTAEHHIIAGARVSDDETPGYMKQRRRADAQLPGEHAHAPGHCWVDLLAGLEDTRAIAMDIEEPKGGCWLGDFRKALPEIGLGVL